MDGKLLVLCDERPTINEHGGRIDEKGSLLAQQENKWFNFEGKEIEVDPYKKVISAIDLLNEMMTETTEPDILFVDWETVVPSDISQLQQMKLYAQSTEEIPPQMLFDAAVKNPSLMKRAHYDRLISIDNMRMRPSFDYGPQAMDDFLGLFSRALSLNMIVSVLPTFSVQQAADVTNARWRVLQTWKNKNQMMSEHRNEPKVEVLQPMQYKDFGEIYIRAKDEMLKIISKPYLFEEKNTTTDPEEGDPGGRD